MSNELALLGGQPVRLHPFPSYNVISEEEIDSVVEVMKTGILSKFIGAWHEDFLGGPQVRLFEHEWSHFFNVKHCISVNSATSGLYAACGAAGIGPGDEVIVSPYTMSASAIAPIIYNAVPIFADIDPSNYCLSADTILPKITKRTKAIIVVHIFGFPIDMEPIMKIAEAHNIIVIEDVAQAPMAKSNGHYSGTSGHMGIFSLNYHKHIHTGEGGLVVTNNPVLADKLQLIRNHAESVVSKKITSDYVNMIGFNYRLGEMEAAIGRSLLKKLPFLVNKRRENVRYLESKISHLPGLTFTDVNNQIEHSYYVHAIRYDEDLVGIPRELFARALRAELPKTLMRESEGVLIGEGYVKPLYLLPIFQNKITYGQKPCVFNCPHYEGDISYYKGMCPNTEKAHETILTHELMRSSMHISDMEDVANAFLKVHKNINQLKKSIL